MTEKGVITWTPAHTKYTRSRKATSSKSSRARPSPQEAPAVRGRDFARAKSRGIEQFMPETSFESVHLHGDSDGTCSSTEKDRAMLWRRKQEGRYSCAACERASGPHRRGIRRVPRGFSRIEWRYRASHQRSAQEGTGRGAEKGAAGDVSEGIVGYYIHAGGKIGVLVEVNCESDFVARTEDFQKFCHDVAMHIAALDPRFLKREEVTQDTLDREREIYQRTGEIDRQARNGDRKDRERKDGEILRRELLVRAALHQGRGSDGEGAG